MICRFTIQGTLPGLNEYINAERSNRYAANSMKQTAQEQIGYCLLPLHGLKITTPVHIKYKWIEPNRKRDKDNIAFAKKFIQDALVKNGVLENDGWKQIDGFEDSFGVDKNNPRIEVEIIGHARQAG